MAVRRWMFEALGGFDGRMKAGWEDADICLSAWLRGWGTVYVPEALCWHRVGATSKTGEGRVIRRRGELEGRLILATRHLPLESVALTWASTLIAALRDGLTGSRDSARLAFSAMINGVGWLPALAAERRRMYRVAGTSPRKQLATLEALTDDAEPGDAVDRPEADQ
jgi:GT2 family glycosyltransferase